MKKTILLLAIGLAASTAFGQTYEDCYKTSWFIQGQVGAAVTMRDNDVRDNFDKNTASPHFGLSIGKYFIPALGARIQFSGWQSENYMNSWNQDHEGMYVKHYFQTSLDALVSIMNLIDSKKDHKLDFIVVGGMGWAHGFGKTNRGISSSNSFVGRLGLQADVRVSEKVSINLELTNNWVPKNFDVNIEPKKNGFILTPLFGVTYRLGRKHCPEHIVQAPVYTPAPAPAPVIRTEKIVVQPKPIVPKTTVRVLDNAEIFFKLNSAVIEKDQKESIEGIVKYMHEYPRSTVALTGYTDKETGSHEYNQKLSEARVMAIQETLIKHYGIDSKRISIKAVGETQQPFTHDEYKKNRVAIGIVSEVETTY